MNKKETLLEIETPHEEEVRHLDAICVNESHFEQKWYQNWKYAIVGILL